VLATTRAGHAKSNITEEQRRTYICAECRYDAAERARVASVKAEKARMAAEAARARRRLQKFAEMPTRTIVRSPRIGRLDVRGIVDVEQGGFDLHAGWTDGASRSKGGRPRLHDTDTARRTAAQRTWRARRKVPA
jgi:hypothetical protein